MLEAWSGTHKSLVEPTTNYWNSNSPYRARHVPRWSGTYYHSTGKGCGIGCPASWSFVCAMRNAS